MPFLNVNEFLLFPYVRIRNPTSCLRASYAEHVEVEQTTSLGHSTSSLQVTNPFVT